MVKILLFPFAFMAVSSLAWGQLNPSLNPPIVEKQKKVKVTVHEAGTWKVTIFDSAVPAVKKAELTQALVEGDSGLLTFDFSESVPDGFEKGWVVELSLQTTAASAGPPPVPAVFTAPKAKTTVQVNNVSIFLTPPMEGDQVIKGSVVGTAEEVRVEVLSATGSPVDFDTASVTNGDNDNPGKSFTAGMNKRLVAGQTVRVTALKDGSEVGATTDFALVGTTIFDWGRVRAYFTLGATIAQQDTDTVTGTDTTRDREFKSADYYVSLAVDYNWLSSLQNRFAVPCQRPARAMEELTQLEELVDRWDGSDFKRRMNGIDDPQQRYLRSVETVKQFKLVLDSAITSLKQRAGTNCLSIEDARVGILESAARMLPKEDQELELAMGMRPTIDKTYVSQLKADSRAVLDAAAKNSNKLQAAAAAAPVVQERLETIKSALGQLDNDLEEFRNGNPEEPRGGWLFNTSFEARLGQAPIAGATTPTAPAAILQSANSGYVGIDAYSPWWPKRTSWRFADKDYALFIAPLARVGVLAASTPVTFATSSPNPPELFRHLYVNRSYGIRFGHFALDPRSKTVAPELLSFLDITYGKFDNFRYLRASADNQPSTADFVPWRTEISGRLKIPQTPAYVGFTANVGPGKDDLRFFFGTRFDFSKLLSKLVPANP